MQSAFALESALMVIKLGIEGLSNESLYYAFQFPLDGVKLDLDEAILKGRTKDLIGYLHEKLKHVSKIVI